MESALQDAGAGHFGRRLRRDSRPSATELASPASRIANASSIDVTPTAPEGGRVLHPDHADAAAIDLGEGLDRGARRDQTNDAALAPAAERKRAGTSFGGGQEPTSLPRQSDHDLRPVQVEVEPDRASFLRFPTWVVEIAQRTETNVRSCAVGLRKADRHLSANPG